MSDKRPDMTEKKSPTTYCEKYLWFCDLLWANVQWGNTLKPDEKFVQNSSIEYLLNENDSWFFLALIQHSGFLWCTLQWSLHSVSVVCLNYMSQKFRLFQCIKFIRSKLSIFSAHVPGECISDIRRRPDHAPSCHALGCPRRQSDWRERRGRGEGGEGSATHQRLSRIIGGG